MHQHLRNYKTIVLQDERGRTLLHTSFSMITLVYLVLLLGLLMGLAIFNQRYNDWGLQTIQPLNQTKLVNKIQKNALQKIAQETETIKKDLLALQKESAYLNSLFTVEQSIEPSLSLNDEHEDRNKVSIKKEFLGERIEKDSVLIGNRSILEFYEDTEKNTNTEMSAEDRALVAAKQLKQLISRRILPGKVAIQNMGNETFIGTLGRHTMFRIDETDSKFMNLPAEEVARRFSQNINQEITQIEQNKKRLTMRRYIDLPFSGTTTRLSKEIDFLAQKMLAEKDTYAVLSEQIGKIQLQYAYTPSSYPVNRPITSTFGLRQHPVTRSMKFHSGLDFWAWPGTQVHAAASGRVSYAGWHNGYGYTVIIQHGRGTSTLYGHNSRLLVRSGSWVNKGQVVSLSGATGLANGAHLHYEVRQWNNPVNPVAFLNLNILTASQIEND